MYKLHVHACTYILHAACDPFIMYIVYVHVHVHVVTVTISIPVYVSVGVQ